MVDVRVENDLSKWQSKINKLKLRAKQTDKLMRQISVDYQKVVDLRFRKEIDPDGNNWLPLSEKYLQAEKRRGRETRKILSRTGKMRNSIRRSSSKSEATLKASRIQARSHQYGDLKRNIPARPFFGINKQQKTKYSKMIAKYILDK